MSLSSNSVSCFITIVQISPILLFGSHLNFALKVEDVTEKYLEEVKKHINEFTNLYLDSNFLLMLC